MISRLLQARATILAAFVLAIAVSIWGASSLTIDPNNRVFFGPQDQKFSDLQDLEASFGSNTNLFFVVHSASSLFDDSTLAAAVRWLADRVWQIDDVVAADSIASYPHVVEEDHTMVVENLLDYVCPERLGCVPQRSAALDKLYLVNRLISSDGKSASVVAKVNLSSPTPDQVSRISNQSKQLVAEFRGQFPDTSIYLTGGVPMMDAFVTAAQRDSGSLLVAVVILLSLGLYLFLGGIVPTALMLLLGLSSVLISLGAAGLYGLVINTATATVPLVVFTLVVASAMHVFLHIVREERLESRDAVERATVTAVRANWRPVLLTASTTAIGWLSMVFVSAPPLRELGVLAAIGVMAGAVLTLTVVPCLFSMLSRVRASKFLLGVQELMNRYARWMEHKRPKMIGVFVLFALALVGISRVEVDEDFVRYFGSATSFRIDTEAITGLLAGPYHVDVIYDSGSASGVFDGMSIRELSDLTKFLRVRPEVVNVASVLDVLTEVSNALTGDSQIQNRKTDELAQMFLTYELSLGIGQSAKDLLDSAQQKARVSVLLSDVSMAEIRGLASATESWAAERGIGNKVIVTGEGIPTANLSKESIRQMSAGIAISVFLSAVMVGIYFRSGRACLSILAATCVPILAGFGVWGWTESEIGMAATLVVATTIGVVIDDTIHLTYRYVDSLRHLDLTGWGATAYSVHKTGTAIFVTSAVLVVGLMVLIISDFRMNSTFGVCSSLIIALALVYNLTIAPRLLNHLR